MDPEIKKLWIEALRSGEYEQCIGALHDATGYCCIGVLRELVVPDNVGEFCDTYTEIRDASGLSPEAEGECIDWNDGEKLTFLQIADKLEKDEEI